MENKNSHNPTSQDSNDLMSQVGKDLENFFKGNQNRGVYTCEADMQVSLAQFLRSSAHYDDVLVEYKIPQIIYQQRLRDEKLNIPSPIYPWENDMRVDIVIKGREKKYVLIELKYITSELMGKELFGEVIKDVPILKNHDATNLLCYNYWRDVRRIEMLKSIFPNIIGGFAVVLTNNPSLMTGARKDALYKKFSIENDREISNSKGPTLLDWEEINGRKMKEEITQVYPEFILEGNYKCNWETSCLGDIEQEKGQFFYMILPIDIKKPSFYSTPNVFTVGQNTTAQELIDWFDKFNLNLRIYVNDKKTRLVKNPETILTQMGANKGPIRFRSSITVGELLKRFACELGIHVSIFTKDGNVKVLDNISLASAQKIPAGATRKSMESYISYRHKKSDSKCNK